MSLSFCTDQQRVLVGLHGLYGALVGTYRGLGTEGDHDSGGAGLVSSADAFPPRGIHVPADAAGVPVCDGRRGGGNSAFYPGETRGGAENKSGSDCHHLPPPLRPPLFPGVNGDLDKLLA